jgi:probable O-glycosylation ligase (exosortase A-associated)
MGLTIIATIGTYSRGALVALAACAVVYTVKSRSSIIPLVLGALVLVALPSLVPAQWFDRMSTIKSASADESFQERIQAWKTSINIAEGRPITGGGFSSINLDWVAQRYHSPGSLDIGRASHSMYMQVLSDHGFVGIAIYLMLLVAAWFNTSSIIKRTRDRPELDWANRLARMTQVSIAGYVVGGAALSMAYYDGFLLVLSLTAALSAVVHRYSVGEEAATAPRWKMMADSVPEPRLSIGNARQNSA